MPSMYEIKDGARQKAHNARHAFTSWHAFHEWISVSDTALDQHGDLTRSGHSNTQWSNEDLDPTPPEKRTWRWYNYVVFYWALSFGNWTLGSAMIGIGLTAPQAIAIIFASQFISSVAMFFNSRCASVYHIGYPVVARSVFGMYGAYYFVLARALLAIIWFGVQAISGGLLAANMLRAVFGHNFTDIPNTIPKSIGITSGNLLAFFLFWLLHIPLAMLRLYQLRKFFWFKVIIMIPAIWGLFIFCMVNTGGKIGLGHLQTPSAIAGSGKGWLFIWAINTGMGNTATLITNQPDIARWSRTKTGAMWSQLITNPIAVTLSASLGILSTAAINHAWGLSLWNPWDLMDAILTRYWSAGTRTAVFFCSAGWCVSILGTNVAANMVPFGSDVTLLLPRYLTIPRGQILVMILAFAICPWKILASAGTFTTFLAGYGLFFASVVAIMVVEYFLLTKGNVFIGHLYDGSNLNKHYYYTKGWNVQAVIAYLVGIALPFAGFVGTLGPHVSAVASDMGHMGWLLSFVTTFIIYYALCLVWPTQNQKLIREAGLRWEEQSTLQITAEDGTVLPEEQLGYPDKHLEAVTEKRWTEDDYIADAVRPHGKAY